MNLKSFVFALAFVGVGCTVSAQQTAPSALKKAEPLITYVTEKVKLNPDEKSTLTEIIVSRDELTAKKTAGLQPAEREAVQKETFAAMMLKLKEKFPKERLAEIIAARTEYFNTMKQKPAPANAESTIAQTVAPVISSITTAVSFTPAEINTLTEIFSWRERTVTEQLTPALSKEERQAVYNNAYNATVLKLKEKFPKEKVDAIMAARKKHYETKTP